MKNNHNHLPSDAPTDPELASWNSERDPKELQELVAARLAKLSHIDLGI